MSLPTQIQVYGGNHSPWVPAVLLGVYDRQIPHTVRTVPPLSLFLHSGIMMPRQNSIRRLGCWIPSVFLRAWISRVQTRFEGYEHLYSAPFFKPRGIEPEKAPRFERAFYWLSCLCIWLVFPITLAVTLFYVARVNRLNLR